MGEEECVRVYQGEDEGMQATAPPPYRLLPLP